MGDMLSQEEINELLNSCNDNKKGDNNMKTNINKVVFNAKVNGEVKTMEFNVIQEQDLLAQTIAAIGSIGAECIYIPLLGYDKNNKEHVLGTKQTFIDACIENKIKIGDDSMSKANNEKTMTADEWAKICMEEAAQYVAENGTDTTKQYVSEHSDDPEVLNRAVGLTEQTSGVSSNGVGEKLNGALVYCKTKGIALWNKIKEICAWVWRKACALAVGTAHFALDTINIVGGHAIAAVSEIVESFNVNIVKKVVEA
jgi:hypothetical protein